MDKQMSFGKLILNSPIIGDVAKKVASLKVNHDAGNIAEHFTKFLKPQYASTDTLREEVFKIRHNVYCEELAFENQKDNGMELDEFDPHSIFALIKHKPTNNYTSCVRIVRSSSDDELLPIEKFCYDSIQNKDYDPKRFKRSEIGEISRLAVKADFRRRKSDRFKGSAIGAIHESTYSESELRCFPFIAIGLYMVAGTLAIDKGIKHAFVMMEPRLARSMKFVGIKFVQIGEPIEYHGLRAPYYINAEIFLDNLTSGFKSLYKEIQKDIRGQF
jgi:N-acyl amino acid synthase of PEP-CTERM/exosortase system